MPTIRVMTYNVHSCRGMDGKIIPERIAKVIESFNPDIVALQELKIHRHATKNIDQPLIIAQHLRMHCHFQPAIAVEGEDFGISIMSRYPLEIKRAGHLPNHPSILPKVRGINILLQPREAIWCNIKIENKELHLINTHLGLRSAERLVQVKALLDDTWLGKAQKENKPMILCGDFNAGPRSKPYHLLSEHFQEVKICSKFKRKKTFMSFMPFIELDHIFFNKHLTLKNIEIPRSRSTRIASDHLPIIAEFEI